MKRLLLGVTTALVMTAPAWAQTDLDADADGLVTFEEVMAVYPDITAEDFAAMDTDGDGVLNADEIAAAQAAGLLDAPDALDAEEY